MSHSSKEETIDIRKANHDDINEIHRVLSESFGPYRKFYTKESYDATVISNDEIKNRINREDVDVLVFIYDGRIAGTVCLDVMNGKILHVRSMGVRPGFQGKGIGKKILYEIDRIAKEKECDTISLECYDPLIKAIRLYEKFGFRRTGKEIDYHGITVFEMIYNVG